MRLDSLQYARRFDHVSGSAIREIFKVIAQPGMISIAGGNPSLAALPDAEAAEIARDVLRDQGKVILQYGATEGYRPLLETMQSWIPETLGFDAPAVLPVTGSTQAMDLLCKALINPGDRIVVENPSFLGNLQCMRLYEAELVPVESEEDGLDVNHLERIFRDCRPKMLYTIPTFQNPTGRTLSLAKRRRVAELAEEYGVIVAEDDPYRDLRYRGESLPAIKSFDREGWVVYLGSFSKIISPGMRVGYMVGDPGLIRKCTIRKQSSDLHTANLTQAIVDQFIRRGLLPDHIRRISADYAAQCDTMLGCLESFPEGISFTRPEGGLFLWVDLPEGIDAKDLLKKAIERKVAFVPGTHFYAFGGHENTLRLNFSASTLPQITQGMDVLRNLVTEAAEA
ncbi:MAG: PLP-dependent aminotransferase family protein [Clostridia bacterium]|nr:PLP-dependent aminotransferase family protein [Clostridia bacterium]